MQASQGGLPGLHPEVLVRFKNATGGHGAITGPYRGYLYYWKTARHDVIDDVTSQLWPYLGEVKRIQLATAACDVGRATPEVHPHPRSALGECAWAAGLFDAEGCVSLSSDRRRRPDWRGPLMEVAQSSRDDIPETLKRFLAVVGVGGVGGPRIVPSPWTKLPQYRWRVTGRHEVSSAVRVVWPFLSSVKREQIRGISAHLDPDLDLS
jgi:hypothetical protein